MDNELIVCLRIIEQNQHRIEEKLDALIDALAEDEEEEELVDMDGFSYGHSRDDSEVL